MTIVENQFVELVGVLKSINSNLSVLATYAQYLHQQALGERTYEIDGYVRSTTSHGDKCVWLYSANPGMQYRVTTVYEERLHELPFDTSKGKLYDGEVAPSRANAELKGYFVKVKPFHIATLPTGKKTEAGHMQYRFSRVLLALESEFKAETEGEWVAVKAEIKADSKAKANAGERSGPLEPNVLCAWLSGQADRFPGRTASKGQRYDLHTALTGLIPDDDVRRQVQGYLTSYRSKADMPDNILLALHAWLRPAPSNGHTDRFAADEVAAILQMLDLDNGVVAEEVQVEQPALDLDDAGDEEQTPVQALDNAGARKAIHPAWDSSGDAAEWSVRMGVFTDDDVAHTVLQLKWQEWGKPAQAEFFQQWENYIIEMRKEKKAEAAL